MRMVLPRPLLLCSIVLFGVLPRPASAELSFTFEVSGKYEDNVTGLDADNPNIGADSRRGSDGVGHQKSGPGGGGLDDFVSGGAGTKQADLSASVYADIGTDHALSDATSLQFLMSAEHTAYDKFSEFDFTVGTASAAVSHRISDMLTGKVEASVARKDFKGNAADSTVLGLAASLKERLSEPFWLKQSVDVEQSAARSSVSDYTGMGAGIRAGYDLSKKASLAAGYSYMLRDFPNSPVNAQLISQVVSLDLSVDLTDDWSLLAGYDHDFLKVKSGLASASAGNNIYSAGVRYEF